MVLADKLKQLGLYFITDPKGSVYAIQGGFLADIQKGGKKSIGYISGMTVDELKSKGLGALIQSVSFPINTVDDWAKLGIDAQSYLMNTSGGDLKNLSELEALANDKSKMLEGVYNGMTDVTSFGKGGYYTKEQLGEILGKTNKGIDTTPYKTMPLATDAHYKSIGKESPYGEVNPNNPEEWLPKSYTDNRTPEQKASDEALKVKMQGEQAKETARLAEVKKYQDAGQPVPRSLIQGTMGEVPANGKVPTSIEQTASGFNIVNEVTGEVMRTIPIAGTTPEVAQAQALAVQNQITTGGTPSLTGRPDLYAVEPTQAEKDATYGKAFAPYTDPATGTTVTPKTATQEQLTQQQAGTLPNYNSVVAPATPAKTESGGSTTPTQTMDNVISEAENTVSSLETTAVTADPSLVVTPEMRANWLQEAMDSLRKNKNYQEVIRNAEFDLGQSLNRLVEDTRLRELSLAQEFKTNLKSQQANLRDTGMLYGGAGGGVRGQQERTLADTTNLNLQSLDTQFRTGMQDISKTAERTLGTGAYDTFTAGAQGLAKGLGNTQSVGRVIAGSPVYKTGGNVPVLQTLGGQMGSIPRSIEAEALTRQGEKEAAYRKEFSTVTP